MPPKAAASSRNITDFFKPFTIPKDRVPRRDIEDEIVVASSPSKTSKQRNERPIPARKVVSSPLKSQSPVKRGPGRPRKDGRVNPKKGQSGGQPAQHAVLRDPTPVRHSPRRVTIDTDGACDIPPPTSSLTPIKSSQSTPTLVRQLQAVEIPSSRPPPPEMRPDLDSKKPVTSFSSFSSMPVSSQSSSRRIVKNGVHAVTNSDSASMSSSSDDELMDLDALIPRKKRKITPPGKNRSHAGSGPSTSKVTRSSLRQSSGRSAASITAWKPPSPPPTATYKHSLAKLLIQHDQDEASEAKIKDAEARVQEAERQRQEEESRFLQEEDRLAAAAAYAENSDEGERMKQAIERTDALRRQEQFYFFGGSVKTHVDTELSSAELEASGLEFLADEATRKDACATGFLSAIAFKQGLPHTVTKWLQQSLLADPSQDLCESYVAVLDAHVQGDHPLTDPIFALSEAYAGHTFRDSSDTRLRPSPLPANLNFALKSMASLAPTTNSLDQACALAELILLLDDDQVATSPSLQISVETALTAILASDSTDELRELYHQTTRQILSASLSPPLLARAIARLPATTLPLHNLRRKLALHFLLEVSTSEALDPTNPETGTRLLKHLRSHPRFAVSEATDYPYLLSLISLLDIGIDAGFSDFAFLSAPSEPSNTIEPLPAPAKSSSLFPNASTRPPAPPGEMAFNKQVGVLASTLRAMFSRIRDAGTSHLKRTEAKSALERLCLRLEVCVRTRTKGRKQVFGGAGSGEKFLRGFLGKGKGLGRAGNTGSKEGEEAVVGKKKAGKVRFSGLDGTQDSDAGGESAGKSEGGGVEAASGADDTEPDAGTAVSGAEVAERAVEKQTAGPASVQGDAGTGAGTEADA